jgi:transcriptional regulator with XRE-family HTH domain
MGKEKPLEVWEVFRRQLRAARKARRWTSVELAERIRELGFDGPDASRIRQLETVRDRVENTRLTEVIACAAALGVAPVYLIAPLEDDVSVQFGGFPVPGGVYRNWAEGRIAIGGWPEDWFFFYCEFAPQWRRKFLEDWAKKAAKDDPEGQGPQDVRVSIARTRHKDLARLIAKAEAERSE